MNPAARVLEVVTRPSVVLGLRVLWDFAAGAALLIGLAFADANLRVVGVVTIMAGVWTLAAERRAWGRGKKSRVVVR